MTTTDKALATDKAVVLADRPAALSRPHGTEAPERQDSASRSSRRAIVRSQTTRSQTDRAPAISFRRAELAATGSSLIAVITAAAGMVLESNTMSGLAILSAVATTGLIMVAVRSLRRRVAMSERRIRDLRSEHEISEHRGRIPANAGQRLRALERTTYAILAQREMAASMEADGRTQMLPHQQSTHLLSTEQTVIAVDATLEQCSPLEADRIVREYDAMGDLSLKSLRTLARGLRHRGYIVRALDYFRAAAAFDDPADIRQAHLQETEVMVLSGRFQLTVPRRKVVPLSNRVLHVVGKRLPTTQNGYTIRTHNTAVAQISAGWRPWVFVQSGTADDASRTATVVDGVTYCRENGLLPNDAGRVEWLQSNAEALLKVACDVRPSVLHAHSDFYNAMLAAAVGRATNIPVVYETRGFWEESWLSRAADSYGWDRPGEVFEEYGVPEAYQWRRDREAEMRLAADHVVTLGPAMSKRIVEDGLAADHITVVPNAVDTDAFGPIQRNDRLAERCGIPEDAVVVGCVTSLVEYEGIDTLLESFAELRTMVGRKLWLLVVGGGRVLPELREQARRLGLDAITFTDRVAYAEIPEYYSLIDIIVVPRRATAVCELVPPLKPFEALAAGKVVVMSRAQALLEIDSEAEVVQYYDASTDGSLSALLCNLVVDDRRRAELQHKARAWVTSRRSWKTNAELYRQVYERVQLRISDTIRELVR